MAALTVGSRCSTTSRQLTGSASGRIFLWQWSSLPAFLVASFGDRICSSGSFSYAETDRRGQYDLRFDSQTRGTTAGTKIVRISMNRRIRGLNSNSEGGPGDRAGGKSKKLPPEMIPERYNVHSSLKVEVTSDTKRFDFDLKSQMTPAAILRLISACGLVSQS